MEETTENILTAPLLITRGAIIFPTASSNIDVGRKISVAALKKAQEQNNSEIVVVSQINVSAAQPVLEEVMNVGTLCKIEAVNFVNGIYRVRCSGLKRVRLCSIATDYFENEQCYSCDFTEYPLVKEKNTNKILDDVSIIIDKVLNNKNRMPIPAHVLLAIKHNMSPEDASNKFSHYFDIPFDKRRKLLEESRISVRLEMLKNILLDSQLSEEIDQDVADNIRSRNETAQKEYILREKMRALQEELDSLNPDEEEDSMESYLKKLEEKPYPETLKKKMKSEIARFKQLPTSSVESSMAKGYIDTVMSLPWFEESEDNNDIEHAEQILNEDHYGLEKVKERILEYLAVKTVTNSLKAPILCLYGPPGTGKTSLAKSVARALNRKFVKASLGGTSDEAEIRGHRRTYVASMPGKIIKGMKTAGVKNPVFLLDEIDKVTSNIHGDPASALLEVLDPEQNSFFQDNYIEEPYDLSKVLFIATANYLENVPPALRDRLELIELNTYTNEEKYHIAIEHLIPKQCKSNGIAENKIEFTSEALYYIMDHYTREAGVRELERKIGTIIRKSLVAQLKNHTSRKQKITISKVKEYLGTEYFDISAKEKKDSIGVVTGLAYTQFGGDTLPIEVNYFEGKGGLILTGNLGNVMKESASIALDYVRANAKRYQIPTDLLQKIDIHIHVPEGAVPKDGPSAGIALTVALVSSLSNRPVSSSVAMTGEVTLRGKALAIGGLKEKSLAAYRAGIKKILIPRENERNLKDLPQVVKDNVEFVLLDNVDDALNQALV